MKNTSLNEEFIFWGIVVPILILLFLFMSVCEYVKAEDLGRIKYQVYCSRCHGDQGYGNGSDARYYLPRPRNLVKDPFINGESENQIVNTIRYGFNQMPQFDYLTNDERHVIAIYVRTLRNE